MIRWHHERTQQPILEIKTHVTRKLSFTHRDTKMSFFWSYESTRAVEGGRAGVLALRAMTGEQKRDYPLVAQMIRSRATRTPGTKRTSAGNGGKLVLEQHATDHLDEALIVATCLAMLKREAHQRRINQFACMFVAVSL